MRLCRKKVSTVRLLRHKISLPSKQELSKVSQVHQDSKVDVSTGQLVNSSSIKINRSSTLLLLNLPPADKATDHLGTTCPSRSKPLPMWEGHWSCPGATNCGARWGRGRCNGAKSAQWAEVGMIRQRPVRDGAEVSVRCGRGRRTLEATYPSELRMSTRARGNMPLGIAHIDAHSRQHAPQNCAC